MRKPTSASQHARAVAVAAILLAGCTAGPGGTPSAATPKTTASTAPTARVSSGVSTASPMASPLPNTAFTADDEKIAKLISAGAEVAIPQLMALNASDPSKLEDIFLPLGVWIASQKAGVESYSASSCTSAAVTRFIEGLDRYDTIREQFLAWRDWGANGHAFPPGAPRLAHESFDAAVVELGAHCPA